MGDKLKQWLGASTVVAALSYGLLRLAYAQFYAPLSITPEEAGIEKSDLLSQAIVGPAIFFAVVFLYVFVLMIIVAFFAAIYAVPLRRPEQMIVSFRLAVKREKSPQEKETARSLARELRAGMRKSITTAVKSIKALAFGTVPLALLFVCYVLYAESGEAGTQARAGETVTRREVKLGFVSLPLLDIRAIPAKVHWKGEEPPGFVTRGDLDVDCFMFLGVAEATAVLFDPSSASILRIPAADAVFELAPEDQLDDSCRDEEA